jgi:metal-sulfur cluster biosynthetic enzyme
MDNLQVSNGFMKWNVHFLRAVHDWEVEVVLAFFGMLYSLKWRQGGEDCTQLLYSVTIW